MWVSFINKKKETNNILNKKLKKDYELDSREEMMPTPQRTSEEATP